MLDIRGDDPHLHSQRCAGLPGQSISQQVRTRARRLSFSLSRAPSHSLSLSRTRACVRTHANARICVLFEPFLRYHAMSVCQMTYMILRSTDLSNVLSPIECFALIVAGACSFMYRYI